MTDNLVTRDVAYLMRWHRITTETTPDLLWRSAGLWLGRDNNLEPNSKTLQHDSRG